MRILFCVRNFLRFGEFHVFLVFTFITLIPLETLCHRSGMFRRDQIGSAEITIQSNALSFKLDQNNQTKITTTDSSISQTKAEETKKKVTTEKPKNTEQSSVFSTFQTFTAPLQTSPSTKEDAYLATSETSPEEEKSSRVSSSSEEVSLESSYAPPSAHNGSTSEPKSAVPTVLFLTSLGTTATSTVSSAFHYHHTPTSTLITSKKTSTTRRPVMISTSKKPKTTLRPMTPIPGSPIVDKRKRKPKPGRTTIKTTTTTTTTTPSPDNYDYYESGEGFDSAEAKLNSTSPKIPLSKLAIAMIQSSSGFDNSTGAEPVYYPQKTVNLLNILQAYTKQLQVANGSGTTAAEVPVVKIPNTPFRFNMNQLNFAAKVGVSLYYSLIAIIPLIYLAFGGIGRLGIFDAIVGRSASGGIGRRRKKRSQRLNYHHHRGSSTNNNYYKVTDLISKRADYENSHYNDEEYSWILGRISEIILEISLFSDMDEE